MSSDCDNAAVPACRDAAYSMHRANGCSEREDCARWQGRMHAGMLLYAALILLVFVIIVSGPISSLPVAFMVRSPIGERRAHAAASAILTVLHFNRHCAAGFASRVSTADTHAGRAAYRRAACVVTERRRRPAPWPAFTARQTCRARAPH